MTPLAALALALALAAPAVAVPSALTVTSISRTQVNLTWTDDDVTEAYYVERSLSPTAGFSITATTAIGARSHSVAALTPNTQYYFRVRQTGYSNVDDATITPPAGQGGEVQWAKRFGSASGDVGRAVAVDGSGNVVVVGAFEGTTNLGGGALVSAGGSDVFVAKFSNAGAHVWSKRIGGTSDEFPESIAVDGNGDVIVSGYFIGTVNFGGGNLVSAGQADAFLAKYAAAGGAYVWAKRFGDVDADRGYAVSVDASNNVVAVGTFRRYADFGGGTITSGGLGEDTYVAKYSAAGTHLWSRNFWSNSNDIGTGLAVDASGNVIVAGIFLGQLDCGGGVMTNDGRLNHDIFVAKLSAGAGAHQWSKQFGAMANDVLDGVAADASGNVILVGSFGDTVNFGGGALTSAGSGVSDVFVAKYTAAGGHVWSKDFGGAANDTARAVRVDNNGNVVMTGYFQGSVDFGGGSLTTVSGAIDFFVAKFSPAGVHIWSKDFAGASSYAHGSLAVDGVGNTFAVGYFFSAVKFGSVPQLTTAGGADVWLASFAP